MRFDNPGLKIAFTKWPAGSDTYVKQRKPFDGYIASCWKKFSDILKTPKINSGRFWYG